MPVVDQRKEINQTTIKFRLDNESNVNNQLSQKKEKKIVIEVS